MTLPQLEGFVVELGQKKFVAGYIFSFIQRKGVTTIDEITPLSKLFRNQLVEKGYFISTLKIIDKLTDPDGTIKYVFGLADGNRIESVLLFDSPREIHSHNQVKHKFDRSNISRGQDRRTLCVSTQVGCAMACVFCATGQLGLARNLTAGEIVDQVNIVDDEADITNIVFMGMGEPLANYDTVLDAVRILNSAQGHNIGIRRITISTCGIPESIEHLAEDNIHPRLAISLNAPTDAIRQKLMPIAKKYPLERLLRAIAVYQRKTRNRVTFEYCLIKGVNDTGLHARMLVKLIRPFMCNVNLIEYNPHPGCAFKPGSRDAIERFAKVLKDAGIETTVRLKMGRTINAACGQLGAQRTENLE
jgi:23S rRNA (adenine2503-C2)-methyltransferase